ncbi:ADP-ribosylglycohydrolase family protein [Desulfonema ishimotonii]|uniref:ADP-ribosylglycohydrolase family protein n=1 Tax=Desulfonema ishimotonii TaxID=45657 RepID=A0A401FVA3_9BACT|nr:ADP-ribosylglycohydrolase family protein [Desulfonema ishimotonii]GBC60902.1 ADP-ribosylglycohydrolase family protein [Desulfonema ishimotonii]
MTDKRTAMVMASFAADALALGAHWIYDTSEISQKYGRIESLLAPPSDSYHTTRGKGDFTHYGDQMFVLLQSVAEKKSFDLQHFSDQWRRLFEDYDGYIDGATRKTLAYYAREKSPEKAGSHSNDFAGAARIAPLVFLLADDPDALVRAVRAQTRMTHNDTNVIDTAEFFARVTRQVLNGTAPVAAMREVAATDAFEMSPVSMWVSDGLKSEADDSISAIGRFGQACEIMQLFPGVVHLIAKYENDLREALIQSVMAGGDSAARGMITGMVLGAHLGPNALPEEWVCGINRKNEILRLLNRLR